MKFKLRSKTSEQIADEVIGNPSAAALKKSKASKGLKIAKSPQFALTIGDEGAILVYFKKGRVEGRWFASEPSQENLEVFGKALLNNRKAPMLVAFDTLDQHYSQQTLPPVSKMSVGNLLKRRASREFGRTIELQGDYLLNRNESKEWNYMLYALEINGQAQQWMNWVYEQPNRPRGVKVLPLEMAELLKFIAEKEKTEKPALYATGRTWQYFISYNKISGVRQVILKNGKMIFTRLGQPLEGDAATEAGAIEQEVISTIEYLKRIGLKNISDLHLFIIAAQPVVEVIDSSRMGVEASTLITPHQASSMLGWEGIAEPEDRFGDVFLAAFMVSYRKSKNVLWTKPLDKMRKLYMAIPLMRTAGVLIFIATLWLVATSSYNYWNSSQITLIGEGKKAALEKEIAEIRALTDVTPEQLDKILQLYEVYNEIKGAQINPRDFLLNTSWAMQSLSDQMRVQMILWGMAGDTEQNIGAVAPAIGEAAAPVATSAEAAPPAGTPQPVSGRLNINFQVPDNIKGEELEAKANQVVASLALYYPYYTFAILEMPKAKKAGEDFNINFEENIVSDATLQTLTLQTTFTGTEYIPEPNYGGDL